MIIVTKSNVSESELDNIRQRVESLGLKTTSHAARIAW
jgi:hypothetical protein